MADGTVGVAQASSPDRLIDNEQLTVGGQTVYRQRVSVVPAGTFGYSAGSSGTVTLSGSKKVQTITFHAPTTGAATLTINGGDTITCPAGSQFSASYGDGVLVDPALVFTGSDSFYVDYLA